MAQTGKVETLSSTVVVTLMDRHHDVLKVAKQLYIDSDYDTLLFINKDTGETLYTASAQEIREIVDQIRKGN